MLAVDRLEDLGWQLPSQFSDLQFVQSVLLVLLFDLEVEDVKLILEALDLRLLLLYLLLQPPLLNDFLLLCLPQLVLEPLQLFLSVLRPVTPRVR